MFANGSSIKLETREEALVGGHLTAATEAVVEIDEEEEDVVGWSGETNGASVSPSPTSSL